MSVQKVLPWSLPEEALKTKLWDEITNPDSKESLMDIRLKIQGFWQPGQQLELMTPYFEKYYAILKKVVDERDREFAQAFMNGMSPASLARDADETAFKELLNKATGGPTHFFTMFLKKQVETIESAKKARTYCVEQEKKK